VYGNDVDILILNVEYQSKDRLAVQISPAKVVSFSEGCGTKLANFSQRGFDTYHPKA